nr:actin cytoskeleton-regulatory complex protein pan1-like isoform X1 [Microcebus murinus]
MTAGETEEEERGGNGSPLQSTPPPRPYPAAVPKPWVLEETHAHASSLRPRGADGTPESVGSALPWPRGRPGAPPGRADPAQSGLRDPGQVPYVSGIMQYLSFCAWFISLRVMSSSFLHVVAGVRTSFLFKVHSVAISWL